MFTKRQFLVTRAHDAYVMNDARLKWR